jgi:hypothetical protein
MLKFLFFLVVGIFAIAVSFALLVAALALAGALLVLILEVLGLILSRLWDLVEQLGQFLVQVFERAKACWQASPPGVVLPSPTSATREPQEQAEDMPTPQAEPPVAPVLEAIEPLDADDIETVRPEPAAEVSRVETPIEDAQPEPKAEEKPIESLAVKSAESDLPSEPEAKVEPPARETPNLQEAVVDLPSPEVEISPPVIPKPEPEPVPEPPSVSPKPAPPIAKPNPPKVPVSQAPITPPRPPAALPPARPMFPQLPDFVGIGRRRLRLMVEKDPDGRPGVVIVCLLLGAFKEGWRGPIRLTVTAQELTAGSHHPLVRSANMDFNPANPDVIHDYPDGAHFGFREWTTVGRINLNDFQGFSTGLTQLEVTCRGWELRDGGNNGDLIFEDTEALRVILVTGGYYARKQRRVEQLKAVVVVLRLFVCLDGGERNITNRLNRHFEALGARFLRRWVGRDITLRDLINAEFLRRLQGSRLPADIAASAKLSDAPKDLRDWLLQECTEISEEFKPQTPDGEAVKQLATLGELLGGP